MKKSFTLSVIFLGFLLIAKASHITGGEMFYTYTGSSNGLNNYSVTLKFYMRCNSGRQFSNPTVVSVFEKSTNIRLSDINVPLATIQMISISNPDPCISNPPAVCYEVGYYHFSISVPNSPEGYVLASQVNFRIAGITNLAGGYGNIGATYSAEIPGSNASQNNSAKFVGSDLVIVCASNSFSYSFAATDSDGDTLRYSFCDAFQSGTSGGGSSTPTPPPPFQSVPYGPGFNNSSPLGNAVHINSNTGLITGIAPGQGIYVVTVCVEEIRNGVIIATQHKDIQINISPCSIAAAMLQPEYMLCRNTKTISLVNLSNSPLITSYHWEFFNNAGATIFTSSDPTPSYTFPDTGLYTIKLVINRGEPCSDSTTAIAAVYPGFFPDFKYSGICFTKPTVFTNATTTVYGTVNSWTWDFGEATTASDFSIQQNPTFTYPSMGIKNVILTVTNTKGCKDTVTKNISVVDRPPITLAFRDTLICLNDNVQLQAGGSGNFGWTPNHNITGANTSSPIVTPQTTTTYFVDLDDNGCLNKDSVKVRVTDHVNLQAMNDTTICRGDVIQLRITSDGFQYSWTPASQLVNPNMANPDAVTNFTTTYQVTAWIGGCSATDQVIVKTVPYPIAFAGKDTLICYNTSAQLNGFTDGSTVKWTPAASLNNPNILNPVVKPIRTTAYIFSAYDTKGCPKPAYDTVVINVLPAIVAFAGRDTSVVIDQPLQLNATGGIGYDWSPATGLSATNISNPVAIFSASTEELTYQVLVYNEAGCSASDLITVKIFAGLPSVYVPTAFTPNGDGKNDLLKPIAAGIQRIEYFNIYNRWGQLVFSSGLNTQGWDGIIGGQPQGSNVFLWIVKAVDYKGKSYFNKGTVTLIR